MSDTCTITIKPSNLSFEATKGQTLMDATNLNDVSLRCECNSKGTCGKCRVIVDNNGNLEALTSTELESLSTGQISNSHRLACQAVIKGPLTITIPEALMIKEDVYGKTGIKGSFSKDPAVKRFFLEKQRLTLSDGKKFASLASRIQKKVSDPSKKKVTFNNHDVLCKLGSQELIDLDLTVVSHDEKGVTSILKGKRESSLGIALDIGTTTIAVYLCDLTRGIILSADAAINPQRRFGEDVIARIAAINEDSSNLKKQQTLVVKSINSLIKNCLKKAGQENQDIDEMVVVGNTTMQHIFSGFHPGSIGTAPYIPVEQSRLLLKASDMGLDLGPSVPVYIFPVISGFLGGDILSATLADRSYERKSTTLIVDIGTNGELMLCSEKGLWATSCATGPALEGAQISCGMRAAPGAIHKVFAPKGTQTLCFQTIEDKEPKGFCGSGIIDALAVMRKRSIIMKDGKFSQSRKDVYYDSNGTGKKFFLPQSDISISLKDIRQVQLAKAALCVGIEFLLKKTKIKRVDRTILTGAFGSRFNWQNALEIGMMPKILSSGKIKSTENLAGKGAIMAVFNKQRRSEIEEISQKVSFLDLSMAPDFTAAFANATQFP